MWDQRDYREGWPLLTVESEANGDSKSTYERGPYLIGALNSSCRYNRFLSCLGCSSRPSTKYYIASLIHYFALFVPITQQTRQAVMPGRLSLNMWLWVWQCCWFPLFTLHIKVRVQRPATPKKGKYKDDLSSVLLPFSLVQTSYFYIQKLTKFLNLNLNCLS